MDVKIDSYDDLSVNVDSNDICYSCKNNYGCPLVSALESEMVVLRYESITIHECGFYSKNSYGCRINYN